MKDSALNHFLPGRRQSRTGASLLGVLLVVFLSTAAVRSQTDDDDFQVARNLFRDTGDYATAAELFAEFIRNYPRSPHLADARLMLARSLARNERCGPAIGAYEVFYQEHPEHLSSAEARLERAACLESEGDHLRAAAAYEDVQRRHSVGEFAPRALLDAARSYTRGGSLDRATRTYHKLLDEYPTQPLAQTGRYRLAGLHFAAGDGEGAQLLLAQITTRAPKSSEARDALLLSGRIYLFLGRTDEATGAFDRLPDCGMETIASELRRPGAVLLTLEIVSESWEAAALDGIIRLLPGSMPRACHAVLVVGVVDESAESCLIVRNSWGFEWGDEGYGYLTKDYLDTYAVVAHVLDPLP